MTTDTVTLPQCELPSDDRQSATAAGAMGGLVARIVGGGVDINEVRKKTATADRLLHDWQNLEPQAGIEVDDKKIAFSRIMNDGNRKYSVGYVEVDGEILPRLFYKSKSDGGWRVTPGIYPDDGSFSKGDFALSEYGQYTQATKPTEDVVAILTQLENTEARVPEDTTAALLCDFPLSRIADEGDFRIEHEEELIIVTGKGMDSYISGVGFRDSDLPEKNRRDIEEQELPDGFKPDFSRDPIKKYTMQHTMLGECEVEVYPAKYNGQAVDWHIVHDKVGRVWVDRIVPRDAKMTSYGTNSKIIVAGILSSKPIDYSDANQLAGMEQGIDIRKLNENYIDITPILDRQPWLKEYRQVRRIRYI